MTVKNRLIWLLVGAFSLGIISARSDARMSQSGINVQNPDGAQPSVQRIAMAPRLKGLDGKTIYIVDMDYPKTRPFINEIHNVFKEKYPKTNCIIKKKAGDYFEDDPMLWREIQQKGHGMIMGVGH